MTQKTNQFNLTTRRCEIPEITRYVEDEDLALIALEYADRFGAEGIVALALLDLRAGRIDNILMSCRVIGRRVEDRLLQAVIETFRRRGVGTISADYVATKKNEMVASFYDGHGFAAVTEKVSGHKTYQCTLL
jgi:FkbH-like protein